MSELTFVYPYKLAKLKDRDGDLTKSWYMEYYLFDENSDSLVRKRDRIPAAL